ncbi:MAG: hypothetical protein HY587_05650 [Candidatus Omnitrophica bacterium]|nr:hypothetical protein [Candidatus Omnitrophota bacterium]
MRKRGKRTAGINSIRAHLHRPSLRSAEGEVNYLKQHIDKLWEWFTEASERINDLEVHADLMQRLIVSLALEKIGTDLHELRRLIRQAEKEAIADSEVFQLEELFKMPSKGPTHNSFLKKRRRNRKR